MPARAGVLGAGEQDVQVEVLERFRCAEALGESHDHDAARRVVVLAAAGAGESAMSRSRATATISTSVGTNWAIVSAVPSTPARRRSAQASTPELGPEERLEAADRMARKARAVGDPAAAGVGVRYQHECARAWGAALRDDVLGGAPAERPPERGDEQAGVKEREQGRDER